MLRIIIIIIIIIIINLAGNKRERLPPLTTLLMRRLFFFLLLGILMCAGGINKSEPKKCNEHSVSVGRLDLYRAPGPSVTFEPDLWEHRDEGWGAWRARNRPPQLTLVHVHDGSVR